MSDTEVCKPGYHYNTSTGTCKPCPVGTYQTDSGQNYCTACPGDTSTDHPASAHSDDCKGTHSLSESGRESVEA